jgi:hypothetical protein
MICARSVVARDWMIRHGDLPIAAERLHELERDAGRVGSLPGRAEAWTQLVLADALLGRRRAADEALREAQALTARLGPGHRLHLILDVAVATVIAYLYGGAWEPLCETSRKGLEAVAGQQAPLGLVMLAYSAMSEAFSRAPPATRSASRRSCPRSSAPTPTSIRRAALSSSASLLRTSAMT